MKEFFKKHLGWVVTGFLVLLFWMQTCNLQDKIDQGKQQVTQLELDKQTLESKVNAQGDIIWTQNSIITDNTHSLNELTDSIFKLKQKNTETIAYFKNKTNTTLEEVFIPYLDTLAMKTFEDSLIANCPKLNPDSVIPVPMTSFIQTPYFAIKATAKKKGIGIDSLSIPDELQLRFVEHKDGIFKKSTVEVQFFHTNPFIKSVSANSVYYKPKKQSFFKRVIFPVALGVGTGILISK